MKNLFYFSLGLPIVLSIFISCFLVPLISVESTNIIVKNLILPNNSETFSNKFAWPTPTFKNITSYFGYRNSPITGKKAYHGGIDIGASQSSPILTIADGIISYVGWYGANGYSIIVSHKNGYKSIYGHVSPNFTVSLGQVVKKGDVIAKVGPKYIEKKEYTTYKDSSGKYTNGSTTRTSSAFNNHKKW